MWMAPRLWIWKMSVKVSEESRPNVGVDVQRAGESSLELSKFGDGLAGDAA